MFSALAYVHGLLLRLCLWLLKQPFKALWVAFLGVLALVGEEVRRWAGLLTAWLLVVLAGKATLNYAPPSVKKELALVILALLVLLAFATRRAAHLTWANNTVKVRTRKGFQDLQRNAEQAAKGAQQGVVNTAAVKTQGTPFERAFRSNREKQEQARQRADTARLRQEHQIEEEHRAHMEDERHRDELAALEPSPFE